jgi:hypothetical protein
MFPPKDGWYSVADNDPETRCCEKVQSFFFYISSSALPSNRSRFNFRAFSKVTIVTAANMKMCM